MSAFAARLQGRIWGDAPGPLTDVDDVRRLRTRRSLHAVLLAGITFFVLASLIALSGAAFQVMVAWAIGYAVFLAMSAPLLRRGRVAIVRILINGGLTLLLAVVPIVVGTLPPAAPLPLMLMILAAAFVESTRGVLLVYAGTVSCVVVWTAAGLPAEDSMAVGLFSLGYLTVACGLAMVGAARYSRVLHELSCGLAERERLNTQALANNEQLESSVAQRTSELHELLQEKDELLKVLARQAITDDLTGLLNRTGFRAVLQDAERAEPAPSRPHTGNSGTSWLAMIDLDGLKSWNDTFGHLLGDEVLRGVGRALRSITGDRVHAARISGDEFAVLFIDQDGNEVAETCWTVVRMVENALAIPVPGAARSPGISVGLAAFDAADPDGSSMRADRALYEAKRAGGRRVTRENSEQCVSDAFSSNVDPMGSDPTR